nr:recombinase family protein [uncultured Bacillus sp.]
MTVANMIKTLEYILGFQGNLDTLLTHRTIAERYCRDKGYSYKIYEEVISGAKDIEEKQSLNQLLNDIQLYEAIFVISTDRISRDNYYTQYVAKVLEDNDVYILTPKKLYDLNGDDRLMFDMLGAMSSQELRLIAKRQKRGKREGAKRGEWVQGVPPLVYTRGRDKKLEVIESEANLVRTIFNFAESGYGIQSIVSKLKGYKKSWKSIY